MTEVVVERYAELAGQVLAAEPKLGRSRLVAVDGPSGAGKSQFAARLAAAIAGNAPSGDPDLPAVGVVHTDDLLDGWADQLTFWPRLEAQILGPLRAGEAGRYRAYDWLAGRFDPRWHRVAPSAVVLLEGFSSARAAVRPELACAVFVAAPRSLRLDRAVARDGESIRAPLTAWQVIEDRHYAEDRTAECVDLVVDGAPRVPHDHMHQYVRISRWTAAPR